MRRMLSLMLVVLATTSLCLAADEKQSPTSQPAHKARAGKRARNAAKEPKMDKESQEKVWKLGTQAYSFRLYTFFEALDKAKGLGLKYVEAFPGQHLSPDKKDVVWDHNASKEVRELVREKLKKDGITLINYGVVDLGKDEASMRKVFDFAKDMGIQTIVAEPAPGTFDLLDKLTEEYKINIAIHNHPKPSHYWNPETLLEAIKGHSKRIGACADIGHFVRSGIDPIEAIKQLKGHIISLHMKDLNEKSPKAHDVPWGTGVCDVKGVLTELHNQGFSGEFSVEYEHNWDKSVPEIAEGLKYFKQVAKELGQKVE
jgi:sugar phosphate isomerase/epimerase